MKGKYIFLGDGGFAIELYEYMVSENKNVIGYYAQEKSKLVVCSSDAISGVVE